MIHRENTRFKAMSKIRYTWPLMLTFGSTQMWWSTGKRHDSRRERPKWGRQRLESYLFPVDHHKLSNSNCTKVSKIKFGRCSSNLWRSIGKGVLNKTIQIQNVPELWRQTFWKVLLFLWNVTYSVSKIWCQRQNSSLCVPSRYLRLFLLVFPV